MPELTYEDAVAAVKNPTTSAAELAVIAQHHPRLRQAVAIHPNVYDGLLGWMDDLGDPALSYVVGKRRQGLAPTGEPLLGTEEEKSMEAA